MYFDIPNYETISFYNDVGKYDGQKVLSRLSVWLGDKHNVTNIWESCSVTISYTLLCI